MVRFYSLLLPLLLWQCNAPAGQSRITGPAYAGNPIYTGGERFALTEATIGLGAQLFNDPQLSIDSTISCASCHKADAYFSDPGKVKSEGINGHPTERNTSALNNLAWHPYFFAEGGVRTLELSTFVPINNRHEFGRELHQVVEALNENPKYKKAFENAFGASMITDAHFVTAMAHYMASLTNYRTPYDHWLSGDSMALDASEKLGLQLFKTHCSSCHSGAQLSSFKITRNGLPTDADYGRMKITNNSEDSGAFKIPSLRGIALTSPYMHDGSYASLDTVLHAYNSARALHLTPIELDQLKAFLNTLH
ncbi:MAG: hypothetical protein RLZZ599_95 [Bacteroidota bacterium]|jgi:cytochrome c peroxidase